jgi:ADP-heptose:LPS heptosyltransferase
MHSAKMRILVSRRFFGFGDWLMLASAVKEIHVQRPDVQITVDIANIPDEHRACRETLVWFDSGALVTSGADPAKYMGHAQHVAYPHRSNQHLIEQMVQHIVAQCPALVGVPLNPGVRAQCTLCTRPVTALENYILLPSQGMPANQHKEWGSANFGALAEMLKCAGYNVIQVGRRGDRRLRAADENYFQLSLGDMISLVRGSTLVVALENGLSHLAGHLGHPCATLYLHHGIRPVHTHYTNQTPILGEPSLLSSEDVLIRMMDILNGEKRKESITGT